jgi:hypothetical protein
MEAEPTPQFCSGSGKGQRAYVISRRKQKRAPEAVPCKQKPVELPIPALVLPYDIPFGIDSPSKTQNATGHINRREPSSPEQVTMSSAVRSLTPAKPCRLQN